MVHGDERASSPAGPSDAPGAALAMRAAVRDRGDPAEALAYLASLPQTTVRLGLERMEQALAALGHPERGLAVLHVAGTNGKGSTCAFAASCLGQRYRVGLYTSPHLERVNERVRVGGHDIDDEAFGRRVLEVLARLPPALELTPFELTTAVALCHFAREGVEVAVLETGLGGRLDATNCCAPLVTAVTTVDLDHQALLGDSVAAIAAEKAGIIKAGVPVICARQSAAALGVLEVHARERGAPLWVEGREFELVGLGGPAGPPGSATEVGAAQRGEALVWPGAGPAGWGDAPFALGLLGAHQRQNAGVALGCLARLGERGFPLSGDEVRRGLREARWPGRLEVIHGVPPVLLDGAHNTQGVRALRAFLEGAPFAGRPVHLVFGVLSDKAMDAMAEVLLPRAASVCVPPIESPRAREVGACVALAARWCPDASGAADVREALARQTARAASDGGVVVVCGSLYLVGAARAELVGSALVGERGRSTWL